MRYAEQACQMLKLYSRGGTSALVQIALLVNIIDACIKHFLVINTSFLLLCVLYMINIHYTGHHYSRTYGFVGEWNEENMEIQYVTQHPMAELRHEHSATMRLLLEETLGSMGTFLSLCSLINKYKDRLSDMSLAAAVLMTYASGSMSFTHMSQRERKLAITLITAPLFCREGSATQGTVRVHFNILS